MVKVVTHKLTRRLLILSILIGASIVLISPPPTHADECSACNYAWTAQSNQCLSDRNTCEALDHPNCATTYYACITLAVAAYENCLDGCGSEGGGTRGGDPSGGRSPCVQSCDTADYACISNGGVNTSSFQDCMATQNDVEMCCDVERAICLTGC